MGIVDTSYRTVTCSACGKTATFENSQNRGIPQDVVEANPWLRSNRVVLTADGRNFSYCSDLCTISGVESGLLNLQEAPKVEIPTGGAAAQIQAAAAAAKQAELANKALHEGKPASVKLS